MEIDKLPARCSVRNIQLYFVVAVFCCCRCCWWCWCLLIAGIVNELAMCSVRNIQSRVVVRVEFIEDKENTIRRI